MSSEENSSRSSSSTSGENDSGHEEKESSGQDKDSGQEDSSEKDSSGEEENENGNNASDSEEEQKSSSGEDEAEANEKIQKRSTRINSHRTLKMDEQTLLQLENENFLRRSTRRRAETTLTESSSEEKSPPRRKRQRPSTSNESSDEESESSYSDVPRKARKTAKGKSKVETRKRNRAVNYVVPNSDSDSDLDEFMDYEEEETQQSAVVVETGNTDTIEKVLKNRNGVPGATGSQTTWYNIQNQGDPNEKFSELPSSSLERQYLIKWVGWSHLHNTWESEASLRVMGAKGLKKLENYIKKVAEFDAWRRIADKEYVEFYDCEQVMSEELLEQYKDVERVIAHQVSREKTDFGEKQTEFLVKWCGLPYSECTWEDESLIRMRFSHKIDEYFERINVETTPKKTHHYLKRRPKFQKLETIPEFLYPKDNPDLELRDYQLEGLNWLLHAWCKENSCILADEMGLGKTIQTICFLSSLFHLHELYGPFLVVVPLSTMASWLREFETWGSDMNVVTYMGDAVSRGRIREFELYGQARKIKFNVILTTYEILMKDKSLLGTFNWTALVVDEAHRLKNDDSLLYQSLYSFNSNHRLLITGTPLQNSLKELWALLHFIMPEKFDNWPEFEADHQDRDHKAIASLHKKLEPFLLRRVKKDVEKSLPAKVEQILRVDMTAHQKQYYKWILTKNYDELSKGVKGSIKGFVNLVMELKKCCNHSSLVRDYDFIPDDAQSRLHQLLKSSGKLILLDKLLCRLKETGHRVLIFSQMVMMLDILQEYMQLRRFQFQRLDGSMGSDIRKQALDHFNADGSPDFCFLLSTRAGGLGINLATADTVIIFDSDWNPQNDLQAMSRAHRIGQKRQVNIFRLVTKSSVEEDIVERAKQKLVLDHLVIQQMDTTGTTVLSKNRSNPKKLPFDKADLNAILKFGAEELFREKEGEEQEPDVDLDDILSRAEVKQCENQDGGNDLLSSFKYANVDIDEDKDLVMPEMKEENRDKDWDEIIPEDQLEKIKEEARKKEEELLNLGPRQRNKMQELPPGMEADDDEDDGDKKRKKKKASKRRTKEVDSDVDASSDSENEGRGRRGGSKRTVLFGFTEKEVKNFIKSFRKFAHPLERLPAITQDAELEDHRTHEIEELAKEIIRLSDEAEKNHAVEKQQNDDNSNNAEEKKKVDRGPSFKIGSADFRVSLLFKQHAMLEPLHQLITESQQNLREFEIPGKPKQIEGWDVEWSLEDDRSLLQGIHRYGMGSWEAIKMDPEFGLADKIFLKDKAKKPHPADLASRATKLLAFLAKHVKKRKIDKNDEKKSHKKERAKNDKKKPPKLKDEKSNKEKKHKRVSELHNSSNVNSPATPQRPSTSKEKKHNDKSKVLSLRINKEKYSNELADRSGATFKQCVEIFRPVIKHIKKMISEGGPITSEGLKSLRRLGDHITDYICSKTSKSSSDSSSRQEKWHSYLWIFLSKFITPEQDPVVLLEKYRQCLKNRMIEEKKNNQRHHHGHHSSHSNAAQHPQLHNSHHGSNNQHKPHNHQQQNRPSGSSFRTSEDGPTFHH